MSKSLVSLAPPDDPWQGAADWGEKPTNGFSMAYHWVLGSVWYNTIRIIWYCVVWTTYSVKWKPTYGEAEGLALHIIGSWVACDTTQWGLYGIVLCGKVTVLYGWKPTNGESDATCGECSGFLRLHISLCLKCSCWSVLLCSYHIFQMKYLAKMKGKDIFQIKYMAKWKVRFTNVYSDSPSHSQSEFVLISSLLLSYHSVTFATTTYHHHLLMNIFSHASFS